MTLRWANTFLSTFFFKFFHVIQHKNVFDDMHVSLQNYVNQTPV